MPPYHRDIHHHRRLHLLLRCILLMAHACLARFDIRIKGAAMCYRNENPQTEHEPPHHLHP